MYLGPQTFSIVGGDLRNAHLANLLSRAGHRVFALFFDLDVHISERVIRTGELDEALPDSDVVILPLPATLDNQTVNSALSRREIPLADCLEALSPQAVLLGGMLSAPFLDFAQRRGILAIDYFEREEFKIMNAVPTAEGAVSLAMEELPYTILGLPCLITGYGRIGKALARLLCAMGADVTVAARRPSDLAQARIAGCAAVHIADLADAVSACRVLFNTVPAKIFGEDILRNLRRDCLVIDLSSKPGGVDFETAQQLGIRTVWALSLPGKVAPYSAGEIMKETVLNILSECRGQTH